MYLFIFGFFIIAIICLLIVMLLFSKFLISSVKFSTYLKQCTNLWNALTVFRNRELKKMYCSYTKIVFQCIHIHSFIVICLLLMLHCELEATTYLIQPFETFQLTKLTLSNQIFDALASIIRTDKVNSLNKAVNNNLCLCMYKHTYVRIN